MALAGYRALFETGDAVPEGLCSTRIKNTPCSLEAGQISKYIKDINSTHQEKIVEFSKNISKYAVMVKGKPVPNKFTVIDHLELDLSTEPISKCINIKIDDEPAPIGTENVQILYFVL